HDNELCMYNSFFGPTRQFQPIKLNGSNYALADEGDATEVILDFAGEQRWQSNTPVPFVVREVRLNKGKGTLGEHDLALVGRGANATALAALEVGDEVVLNYGWIYNPGSDAECNPAVEQAIGGNAMVMINGELTPYNENETYNSQIYSRTAYGCSQDGKMLYVIVIDKSTDRVHGSSAGCNTAKMCEFARWLGCWNMSNFDAGGSAEMFIEDRIENTTTEGTPRAVANGWLVYSIAPEDADDYNTVTRLEFNDYNLQAPVYSSYTPQIMAYNRYGAVIDRDFQGFTLSCPESLGSCQGNTFTAAGAAATGELTASYGTVSVSKTMNVMASQMSLRIHNLYIDGVREYPLEVTSTIGQTVYGYDPASFEWTVENPNVITIDEAGVLHAVAEGTTTYKCRIGDFEDSATVTVEIAPTPIVGITDWTGWNTKKASGIKDVAISADGVLSYTYDNPRDPSCGVTGEYRFYSLPDALALEFTSTIPVRSMTVDIRSGENTKATKLTIENEDGALYAAGIKHTVHLATDKVADLSDIAAYPLVATGLNFKVERNEANKGAQNIRIDGLYGTYNNNAGVQDVAVASERFTVSPNPVAAGSSFAVRAAGVDLVEIFSTSGVKIDAVQLDSTAETATLTAPATSGTYILRAHHNGGTSSGILIVR
ncbi:MAG: phosphodiester glycosidase family protein, partial [Roseburia sp.]|nr:phosphodiester glycosidase family protein [Roseburia sp.]